MRWDAQQIGIALLLSVVSLGCGASESSPPVASIKGSSGETNLAPRAEQTADPLYPVVEIETSLGKITVKLDREHAPGTVNNFLNYVNSGFYSGTVFHYVDSGTMILGGGYSTDLKTRPVSSAIRNEAHNGVKNQRGTLAMSRLPDVIDSATSQFFVNLADNPSLDHRDQTADGYGYCVFGQVVAGMEVVEQIAQAKVRDSGDFMSTPVKPIVIQAITELD